MSKLHTRKNAKSINQEECCSAKEKGKSKIKKLTPTMVRKKPDTISSKEQDFYFSTS